MAKPSAVNIEDRLASDAEEVADGLIELARKNLETNLSESIRQATEAELISRNAHYEKGIAEALRCRGAVYFMQNKAADALDCYKQALAAFKKINCEKGIAASLNDLGAVHFQISEYAKASKFYFESLRIKEKLNQPLGVANTLSNLGSVYQKQNNYAKAQQMYARSLRMAQKLKNSNLTAINHQNLGEMLIAQKKFKLALTHLNIAADLSIKTGAKIRLASIYNNIGNVRMNFSNYNEALKAFEQSIAISSKEKLKQEFFSANINVSEVFIRQKDYGSAEKKLMLVFRQSKKLKNRFFTAQVLEMLAALKFQTKDFKAAMQFYQQFHRERMQLLNEENIRQTAQFGVKYEVERKEKEAEIYRLKNVELKEVLRNLDVEKKRSDSLLRNILPEEVANDLKNTGKSKVQYFDHVSVMFIDIKDFTVHTEKMNPELLVDRLGLYFTAFENISEKYGIEKIKTVGDAFLCACGVPAPDKKHAEKMVKAAREIIAFSVQQKEIYGSEAFQLRVGIHSGSVIAGIIGSKKFAYDIWGDTVNTAARMEQSSEPGKINISSTTHDLIKRKFTCTYRGKHHAKNKGEVDMFFVE